MVNVVTRYRELADDFVQLLLERTASNDAEEVREKFRVVFEAAVKEFQEGTPADRDGLYEALAAKLEPKLPNWEFSCIANCCGIAVEAGADPAGAISPILDRLAFQLKDAKAINDGLSAIIGSPHLEDVADEVWEDAAAKSTDDAQVIRSYLALSFTGRAAMAMLCRSAPIRQYARDHEALVESIVGCREFNRYGHFLNETLMGMDDATLIVLDLTREMGFRVKLHAVRNNCHLFTLLQGAILSHASADEWTDERPSPLLQQIAKTDRMLADISKEEWAASGMVDAEGGVFDRGIWQFYQWPALQPDGSLETWTKVHPYHPWWVWGETHPSEILEIDGVRVILMGPLEMPRKWSMQFFAPVHPSLKSAVTIEAVLSPASFAGWLERIRETPREPNSLPPQPMMDTVAAGVEAEGNSPEMAASDTSETV